MSRAPRTAGAAVISRRGVQRLRGGHPWIFRSDVEHRPSTPAGIVPIEGPDGAPLGFALWSPLSEISLRRIETDLSRTPDAAWWHEKLRTASHKYSIAPGALLT